MAAYRPFICSICLGDYKDPKFLNCHHSFCMDCLRAGFEDKQGKEIKCPLCRRVTFLPEKGVKGLANNIYVESGEEHMGKGKLYCGNCCSNFLAEFKCKDCSCFLCQNCKDQHMQLEQTKGHILEEYIAEEELTPRHEEIEKCPKHNGKEIVFGCYDCRVECCSECWKTEHDDHNIGSLDDVASAMRKEIKEHVDGIRTKLADFIEEKSEIFTQQVKLNNFISDTHAEVNNIASQLKKRIDEITANIKIELAETQNELNGLLERDLERMEVTNKSVSRMIFSTTDALEQSTNISILKNGKKLISCPDLTIRKRLAPHLAAPKIDETFLLCLCDDNNSPATNILHPTIETNVLHSFTVKTKKLTTVVFLENFHILLLCIDNGSMIDHLSVDGERLGGYKTPFRVNGMAQLGDGSIVITMFNGNRVAKFWLDSNYVSNVRVDGFTHGIAVAHDGNNVIVCCNDAKEDTQREAVNSRLVIMDRTLKTVRKLMVPSGREVVRQAYQNRNKDFVAMTTTRCFVLSMIGGLKFVYEFKDIFHSVSTDRYGNIIVLHEKEGTKMVSLFDASLVWIKHLFTFPYKYSENMPASLATGNDGSLWICISNKVGCIKYTL